MGFVKNIFAKFKRDDYDEYFGDLELDLDEEEEIAEGEEKEFEWNWDNLVKDRHLYKLSDDVQRDKYIRSLVEQVKDASSELDRLGLEYNAVTATLKDMDEIEALPKSEKNALEDIASDIIRIEGEKRDYATKKNLMTDGQFYAMETFAQTIPKVYDEIVEAEEQRTKIKEDLQKLEGEKHASLYREAELRRDIGNYRGMVAVTMFAAVLCVVMLLILQFGFEMDTRIGYALVALVGAVTLTIVYVKYLDATKELGKLSKVINRVILLQNTVKIRYVNNRNLLDYLYVKYDTKSSKDLKNTWDIYEEEKATRQRNEDNEKELGSLQKKLLTLLRKYQLNDVYAWSHNPLALMDHNEMVEIRHAHILRRQKLRSQMDYNKRLAKEGENELKELIREYPKYATEVVEMLNRYS